LSVNNLEAIKFIIYWLFFVSYNAVLMSMQIPVWVERTRLKALTWSMFETDQRFCLVRQMHPPSTRSIVELP